MGQVQPKDYSYLLSDMLKFDPDHNYNQTCNVVLTKNSTLIVLDRGWEGIPETLLINLTCCSFLSICFILIRSLARSQRQLNKNGWLQFIYGDRTSTTNPIENRKHMSSLECSPTINDDLQSLLPMHISPYKCSNKPAFSPSGSDRSELSSIVTDTTGNTTNAAIIADGPINDDTETIVRPATNTQRGSINNLSPRQEETTFPVGIDNSPFNRFKFFRSDSIYRFNNWLLNMSQLEEIRQRKGPDAYQYLLFQQYIIFLLAILTFICVVILLPINVQGNNEGKAFARTTLSNLSTDSNLYWVHAIFATIIVILGVYFMNYFSKVLRTEDDLMSRTTLLVRRIPFTEEASMKEMLLDYFRRRFPGIAITGIQFIQDYRSLEGYEQEYVNAMNAKEYCERQSRTHNREITFRPYKFGRFACCCCCGKVNGISYYNEQKTIINDKINKQVHKLGALVPRSAFISFEKEKMAIEVYSYFKEEQRKEFLCRNCFHLFGTNTFDLSRSLVTYAPYPYDINWLNIGIDMKLLWLRKILLSILLFVIFFFLSTPAFLLKLFELSSAEAIIKRGTGKLGSTLTDFLSPFLLMMLAIILPSIVTYACQLIPYKTISALNHAVMSKVFAFLLMMILILPSAGFLSINAMLEDILTPSESNRTFRWNCLFPVDNGAFFVIYTLQAAILGNTVELLRLPELSLYALYNLMLKSTAEYRTARKWITFEFPFGVSYPRFLLIFTITITYSLACPLIAPAGLLYMICKHLVDRYNLYHVYTPSKINGRIHSTAILYVHISLIMMLFQLFTFLLTKTLYSSVTMYMLIVLLLSLLVFSFHCFYHWFRNINHLTYSVTTRLSRTREKHNFCICSYKPPVLEDLFNCNHLSHVDAS